jgi:hypothetical protein
MARRWRHAGHAYVRRTVAEFELERISANVRGGYDDVQSVVIVGGEACPSGKLD